MKANQNNVKKIRLNVYFLIIFLYLLYLASDSKWNKI